MPEDLNAIAAVQLSLSELHVQFEVLAEALHGACEALVNVAEEAVARGENAIAERAMDAADSAAEKVRALRR